MAHRKELFRRAETHADGLISAYCWSNQDVDELIKLHSAGFLDFLGIGMDENGDNKYWYRINARGRARSKAIMDSLQNPPGTP